MCYLHIALFVFIDNIILAGKFIQAVYFLYLRYTCLMATEQ